MREGWPCLSADLRSHWRYSRASSYCALPRADIQPQQGAIVLGVRVDNGRLQVDYAVTSPPVRGYRIVIFRADRIHGVQVGLRLRRGLLTQLMWWCRSLLRLIALRDCAWILVFHGGWCNGSGDPGACCLYRSMAKRSYGMWSMISPHLPTVVRRSERGGRDFEEKLRSSGTFLNLHCGLASSLAWPSLATRRTSVGQAAVALTNLLMSRWCRWRLWFAGWPRSCGSARDGLTPIAG